MTCVVIPCVSALGRESVSLCGDVSARLVVSCVYERSALCGSTLPCTSFASARFRDSTLPAPGVTSSTLIHVATEAVTTTLSTMTSDNTLTNDSAQLPKLQPVDTDKLPFQWDGNRATITAMLSQTNKFFKRTGTRLWGSL